MIEIRAEGYPFAYVTAKLASQFRMPSIPEFEEGLGETDYSRIVFWHKRFSMWVPYVLFWPEPKDLGALDRMVVNGQFDDTDFENTFRTNVHDLTCFECYSRFSTLVIDGADPYLAYGDKSLGDPELHRRKREKAKALNCPKCDGSLRQLVVKIIRELDEMPLHLR